YIHQQRHADIDAVEPAGFTVCHSDGIDASEGSSLGCAERVAAAAIAEHINAVAEAVRPRHINVVGTAFAAGQDKLATAACAEFSPASRVANGHRRIDIDQ